MAVRLAVFDCDGTLVDGQGAVCVAMERAFTGLALPLPGRSDIRRSVGLSLPQAIRRLLPDHDAQVHDAVVTGYKAAFHAARQAGELNEPLFDGIAALLDALTARGWLLAVATGKSDRGLAHCLARHGIADRFVSLQTADRHPSKPHPAMLEAALAEAGADLAAAVMIGDTQYDMQMAVAAGIRAIGVAWGYHAPQELLAAGAEAVAETPQELESMLR